MRTGIAFHHEPSPVHVERIRHELSGAPHRAPSGPQAGDEYLTRQQVAALLRCTTSGVASLPLPTVKSGPRGTGSRGRRPRLYRRAHVDRILTIRRAARISYSAAAAVVIAEIEGRL